MNAKWLKSKLTSAFSLIELMVVIAIVALLTAIAVPSYQGYLQQSKVTEIFSLASDQMNQWEQQYNLGSTFDVYSTTGEGSYIASTEIADPTFGGGTAQMPSCTTGSLGAVCILLSGTQGSGTTGAGVIDPSLGAVTLMFNPTASGSATGDSTDTSVTWTCTFTGSSDATTATTLLSPGNCTAS